MSPPDAREDASFAIYLQRSGGLAECMILALNVDTFGAESFDEHRIAFVQRPVDADETRAAFHLAYLARASPSQFQAVLLRPEHVADRHLDDAARDGVARLSAHSLRPSPGCGELLRSDRLLPVGTVRSRVGGAVGAAPAARRYPSSRGRAISGSRGIDAGTRDHPRRDHRAHGLPGTHQRLRHAGPAILPRPDGGGSRRPRQ